MTNGFMDIEKIKKLNIPISPGIYEFIDGKNEIIYIGKAANLKSRVFSYWQKSTSHTPAKTQMLGQIAKIKWVETDSEIEALLLESNLIKKHQPYFNVLQRDDKRYAYIKISMADPIPGAFVTRTIDKSGKYFGPFTSALVARETLRAIRKIFPYCAMKKPQKKSCFYYHLGRCLGICGGVVTRQEYMARVIKPLILFLQGHKRKIVRNREKEIRNLKFEIGKLNPESERYLQIQENINYREYQLMSMKQVLASANIIGVAEKYANDVVELAKLLSLPRAPERIEGYDISNIFGREAVGSMVVFSGGEPDKSQYRKFKIKIGQGQANDIGMLREVLERRFKHSIAPLVKGGEGGLKFNIESGQHKIPLAPFDKGGKNSWPLPDLIIIDGGKAQVNVASQVLKKQKLEITVIAISKGGGLRSARAHDKLFFVGEKKPLELPLASPALHLIKRVRDEAHRFAIGYHRKLRGNKFIIDKN